eukprot:CAMPEP_0194064240 /NCGR_PEP_ID=MMETSP0009_2-20130614/82477_1 /TAXON_ID=210454 /ORGANISM="Grammatophora oceanica, Strain CCMP 410" /LENGTH=47 /DNA_ID= /DNA_START= /DNA_END= /DNA_ORIENTATION=
MWERELVGFACQVQDAVQDAVLIAKIVSSCRDDEEEEEEEESSSEEE